MPDAKGVVEPEGQGVGPGAPGGGWGGGWVELEGEGPTACASLPRRRQWASASGCLVSQPPTLLTIPEPHRGAGGREIPPCLRVLWARVWGGGGGVCPRVLDSLTASPSRSPFRARGRDSVRR